MSLKKLTIAMVAALALGAAFANGALAGTPVTRTASWTTGTTQHANTIPTGKANGKAVICEKTAASANFVLTGTVAGAPLKITATGVECSEMIIYNEVQGGGPMAKLTGKITTTGVSVVEPLGCKTPAKNQSNLLEGDVVMDQAVGTKSYIKFQPDAAAGVTNSTTVSLEECAAEGKYPVKGVQYCELTDATEVHTEVQECNRNSTTAGMSSETLGGSAAVTSGEIAFKLASGGAFGLEEF